jgi:hypothetical protein
MWSTSGGWAYTLWIWSKKQTLASIAVSPIVLNGHRYTVIFDANIGLLAHIRLGVSRTGLAKKVSMAKSVGIEG